MHRMKNSARMLLLFLLFAPDPAFDTDAFRARLTSAFVKIENAWCAQNLEPARPFVSDSIYERFQLQLQEQKDLGYRDQMENINVEECLLVDLSRDSHFDALS